MLTAMPNPLQDRLAPLGLNGGLGVVSGIATGWAWHNGAKPASCTAEGTGITGSQGLGIVLGCSAR